MRTAGKSIASDPGETYRQFELSGKAAAVLERIIFNFNQLCASRQVQASRKAPTALESGVVAGGGLALLEASKVLEAIPSEISEATLKL